MNIVEEIDKIISLQDKVKITIGQRVAAMILNSLGFVADRLYLFPKFLENKPVSRLLGKDLLASDFWQQPVVQGFQFGWSPIVVMLQMSGYYKKRHNVFRVSVRSWRMHHHLCMVVTLLCIITVSFMEITYYGYPECRNRLS